MTFVLTVPGTDVPLVHEAGRLVADAASFDAIDGDIWDLVIDERRPALDEFAKRYAAVRTAEQRAMTPEEIRLLPNAPAGHPLAAMWDQRADSHHRFIGAISSLPPRHAVDIGAGCGWLAADLVRRGWQCAAVDVTVDGGDGLAAARHHNEELLLARAEMEALPFATDSIDLAVFNASLHYAGSIKEALEEAARVIAPGGTLVILDSPVFTDPNAGRAMVDELAVHITQTHGVAAAPHEGPGFVTDIDLANFDFRRLDAVGGLHSRLRQWRGARRAGRETATRPLLLTTVGTRGKTENEKMDL